MSDDSVLGKRSSADADDGAPPSKAVDRNGMILALAQLPIWAALIFGFARDLHSQASKTADHIAKTVRLQFCDTYPQFQTPRISERARNMHAVLSGTVARLYGTMRVYEEDLVVKMLDTSEAQHTAWMLAFCSIYPIIDRLGKLTSAYSCLRNVRFAEFSEEQADHLLYAIGRELSLIGRATSHLLMRISRDLPEISRDYFEERASVMHDVYAWETVNRPENYAYHIHRLREEQRDRNAPDAPPPILPAYATTPLDYNEEEALNAIELEISRSM